MKTTNVIYSLEQRNKVTNGGGLSAVFTVCFYLCLVESKSWWGSSDEGHQTIYVDNQIVVSERKRWDSLCFSIYFGESIEVTS